MAFDPDALAAEVAEEFLGAQDTGARLGRRKLREGLQSYFDAAVYASTDETLASLPTASQAPPEVVEEVGRLLQLIPQVHADAVREHLLRGRNQAELAEEWGISQPTVHYRVVSGIRRIRFEAALPPLSPAEVERLLLDAGEEPRAALVGASYWEHRDLMAVPNIKQSSAWNVLWGHRVTGERDADGRPLTTGGLVRRLLAAEDPMLRAVGEGMLGIRDFVPYEHTKRRKRRTKKIFPVVVR